MEMRSITTPSSRRWNPFSHPGAIQFLFRIPIRRIMDAAKIIVDKEKASIGMLQRYLKVGFNRAARIMDQLEEAGIVGPEEGTKPRTVLMNKEQFEAYIDAN